MEEGEAEPGIKVVAGRLIMASLGLAAYPKVMLRTIKLSLIHTLDISHNRLTDLDEAKGIILPSITKLDLSFNNLATLPSKFCVLYPALEELNLSRNNFTLFPYPLLESTSIRTLDLSYNQLVRLPYSIDKLSQAQLSSLNLGHNNIDQLPHTFESLRHLRKLDLSSNSLTFLPTSLGSLPLSSLKSSNNPFTTATIICTTPRLIDLCALVVARRCDPEVWQADNVLPVELREWLQHGGGQKCTGCREEYYGEGVVVKLHRTRIAGESVVVKSGYCSLRCSGPLWKHQTDGTKRPKLRRAGETFEFQVHKSY